MSLRECLERKKTLLADGAMGSMLIAKGMELGDCAELWNVECRDDVLSIHRQYVEAGSDLVLTNSFGANPFRLADHELADRTEELNRLAAEIAREAACSRALVLGDIGPSAKVLEPLGATSEIELIQGFTRQAAGLAEGGVDGFIIETMMNLSEACCAVQAVKKVSEKPVIVSLSFRNNNDRYELVMGEDVHEAVRRLEGLGVDAVGANCMYSYDAYLPLTQQLCSVTRLPVMVQPNAGQPHSVDGAVSYDTSPQVMLKTVPQLLEAGVRIIGGCCGTTPAHIAALRAWLDQSNI